MALKGMEVEKLFKKFKKLQSERVLWEHHWQECSDYCSSNMDDITVKNTPGEKKAQRILDNTAGTESETLANLLHGFLSSSRERFFTLTSGDPMVDKRDANRKWLDKTSNVLWKIIQGSNYQTELHAKNVGEVVHGTATMSIEEDDELIARFRTLPISEVYIDEDFKGFVNQHYRYYDETASNLIEQFGEKKVPEAVLKCYRDHKEDKFKVLHAMYPVWMSGGNERTKYKYISHYVLEKGKEEIAVEGFMENPFITSRWKKLAGEKYGRSQGMLALPEAKMLNAMMYTTLSGAQKVVDPPLQAPDDGFVHPLITTPAGMNYYRAGSTDRITPIFNDSRVDFGIQLVELQQTKIKKCFFTDQLKLPANNGQTNQMSATETIKRLEEAFRLMSPYSSRQEVEHLKPVLERLYAIADRKGLIDEAPKDLADKKIDIVYSSLVALSQRQAISDNILRGLQVMQPFYAVDPSSGDNIDTDAAIRDVAMVYFPTDVLRDEDDIKQIRANRAQQQQKQQQLMEQQANAEAVSKVAPAVAKTTQAQQVG